MKFHIHIFIIFCLCVSNFFCFASQPSVENGIDILFTEEYAGLLKGKRVGLITNHTAFSKQLIPSRELLKKNASLMGYKVTAFFAPEHGLDGAAHQSQHIKDAKDSSGIPIYSLYGKTYRPTEEMLKKIDVLLFDIQDIGSRSYTYTSTLYYAMEEAAKVGIPVIVLDRPNPLNGIVVDGPMLEKKWRSIVGYINVPYCHGMTIGELAKFFNAEYNVGCHLTVVPMKGWKRNMSFKDTGLTWMPTSPHIPEATTPFYYPTTGLLGELNIVSIGVGYTLPFKVIGAPWIDADLFAKQLNAQKFPGVQFYPFHFKPFYGRFAKEECHGVHLVITDPLRYKPLSTQYLIIGILKSLYPVRFKEALSEAAARKDMFCKVNGTEEVYRIMMEEDYIVWKLKALHQEAREAFLPKREKYLIYD